MKSGEKLLIRPEACEHSARRQFAVLTMGLGNAEPVLELTRESIKQYAERCDAEYVEVIGPSLYSMWQHDKFRYYNYMQLYERVLVVDCDILIANDCPNIFDVVPEDSIGIRNDMPDAADLSWLESERKEVAASQHVEPQIFDTLYNTGVVVLSRQHYGVWRQPTYMLCETHSCEQLWIEHQIYSQNYKVFNLPVEFHCHAWNRDFHLRAPGSHIVHFSGVKGRVEAMQHFKEINPRFS